MVALQVGGAGIERRKGPKVMIVLVGIAGVRQVILGDGLYRPSDRVAGNIPANRMEEDFRGVAADTYLTCVLKARRRVRGALQTHRAAIVLRQNREGICAVIKRSGSSCPVLF